jgi:hypothetical protein
MHAVALHADSQRTDLTDGLAGQLDVQCKGRSRSRRWWSHHTHTQRSRSRSRRHSGTGTHTCMMRQGEATVR